MLFRPKDFQKKVARLLAEAVKRSEAAAFLQILELDPQCGAAYLGLGNLAMTAGQFEEAERYYWDGLAQQPCSYVFYFALAQLQKTREQNDELARDLTMLAFRKLSEGREKSPKVIGLLNETMGQATGLDFNNPEAFGLVANVMKSVEREEPADPRLRPYLLLQRLQDEMDRDLLDEIRAAAPGMAPVLEAVLREWALDEDAIDEPSLCLCVALLGEIGPVSALENLLDASAISSQDLFLHSQWAVHRMGQRFPEETLRQFHTRIPDASVSLRCGLAEQLSLMPASPDGAAAARLLLDGFAKMAREEDVGYLLAAAAYALGIHGCVDEAVAAIEQHRGSLNKDGRLAFDAFTETEFVPRLVKEEIDQCDIKDVCIGQVFMDSEGEDEDDEANPIPPASRPLMEFCAAAYQILDEAGAIAGLLRCPEFEELEDGKIAWLEPGGADVRRSYGSIAIRGGRLRLECNSRKRLERGQSLIEDYAGAHVKHLGDSFESVKAALKERE